MRYLRAKKNEGGIALIAMISVIAIALAVMAMITVLAIMNGFREKLITQMVGLNGHIYVDVSGKEPFEVQRLAELSRATPGVVHVVPLIEGQVLAVFNGRAVGALARGISKSDLQSMPVVSKSLSGSLANFQTDEEGQAEIVVGYRLAENLGAAPDMPLTLISPEGAATPFGVTPRRKSYFIGATFNVGVSDYDSSIVYMPIEEARLFFSKLGADRLEIRVKDPQKTDEIMRALRANLGPDVYISDWKMTNHALLTALVVERNAMRLILMIVVLLVTLNLIVGVAMLVKNKTRDIAILRTIGVTQGGITRIFTMAGGTLGLIGTVVGIGLAILFCLNIGAIQDIVSATTGANVFDPEVYALSRIPAKIDWGEIGFISLFSMIFALLAAFLPAVWASRFDPVAALRYE